MRVDYKIPKSTNLSEKNTFNIFFEKLDLLIFTFFLSPIKLKNVIFRFIKFFENFQNCRGTKIFWFLETSMEEDYRIFKSTNFSEKYNFRNFFEKLDLLIFTIFLSPIKLKKRDFSLHKNFREFSKWSGNLNFLVLRNLYGSRI